MVFGGDRPGYFEKTMEYHESKMLFQSVKSQTEYSHKNANKVCLRTYLITVVVECVLA